LVPDLKLQVNKALIKNNQEAWDEIVDQDSKFDKKFNEELLKVIDAKISGMELKRSDNKAFEKDVKMSELEFRSKGLKKMTEKTKK
jgi:hypothetical protein